MLNKSPKQRQDAIKASIKSRIKKMVKGLTKEQAEAKVKALPSYKKYEYSEWLNQWENEGWFSKPLSSLFSTHQKNSSVNPPAPDPTPEPVFSAKNDPIGQGLQDMPFAADFVSPQATGGDTQPIPPSLSPSPGAPGDVSMSFAESAQFMGQLAAGMFIQANVLVFGATFNLEDKTEVKQLENAFGTYLATVSDLQITPGWALAFTVGMFYTAKFMQEECRAEVKQRYGWVADAIKPKPPQRKVALQDEKTNPSVPNREQFEEQLRYASE